MKIRNPSLPKKVAQAGRCELCDRWCRKREGQRPRHRVPEISIRINLISLGSTPSSCCTCHTEIAMGKIKASGALKIVAIRENCRPEEITDHALDETSGEANAWARGPCR